MNCLVILCDTLRRDHCSAYTGGKPLNECWSAEAPVWSVPTPNMQRLADRGTTYTNCWCGSTPCMPARRDIYTGRHEFLERGWAPLEDDDLDLPRQVSGPPNQPLGVALEKGFRVSQLVTDHFHLWEQGSGNYHMGYSGHAFIRGIESDAYRTDPVEFFCPDQARRNKTERHWRNMHVIRQQEEDWTAARVFGKAAQWLRDNRGHEDWYLHIDCFPPHEPLDPPEQIVKQFWPDGYSNEADRAILGNWPYAKWQGAGLSERQKEFHRACYAGNVVLVDRWLGQLLDAMDELKLWDDTLVIFTTDHGTYNGDHGRLGKLQTHQHDAVGHLPIIVYHPQLGHGEVREQLVQLVDIYPTVLSAVGRRRADGPALHGVDLLPTLADATQHTRDYAVAGQFGKSVTLTDGRWILHQSPPDASVDGNQPLYWYSHHLARFQRYDLGAYADGRRPARTASWDAPTWLSDKSVDPNELTNLAEQEPAQLAAMQQALRDTLTKLDAPREQLERLGLN